RVVDLHADSLLWGRDLVRRSRRSHVDVPRLIDGRVVLQALAVTTRVPRHANLARNDDRTDDVVLLALAQAWPRPTYRSLLARAATGRVRRSAPCRRTTSGGSRHRGGAAGSVSGRPPRAPRIRRRWPGQWPTRCRAPALGRSASAHTATAVGGRPSTPAAWS